MSALAPATRRRWPAGRDAVVVVSLANLLCLRNVAAVLDPSADYFLDEPRTVSTYFGTLALIGVLTLAGFGVVTLYRQSAGRVARATEVFFFAVVALAVDGTRVQFQDLVPGETAREVFAFVTRLAAVLVFLIAFVPTVRRLSLRRAVVTAILVLSPFAVVTSAQLLFRSWNVAAQDFSEKPRANIQQAEARPRVVVILMDELDQFLAFEDRAPGLSLPVLDEMVASSFHGTRARSPGLRTDKALPSLLTGRTVVGTRDAGSSDRHLKFEDGSSARFSEVETIFGAATRSGRNVSVVGFYHPYCRVLGDDVGSCSSRSYRSEMQGMDALHVFLHQVVSLVEGYPHGSKLRAFGTGRLSVTRERWHIETVTLVDRRARVAVADERFDLVFVHYPLPHPPGIWDPQRGEFSSNERGTYDGNLALADRNLGGLLSLVEKSARGEETIVVLLSDHGKRNRTKGPLASSRLEPGEDRPVPFLVRFPRGSGLSFDGAFDATSLHDLVPHLLEGRLTSEQGLRDWIVERAVTP